LCASKQKGLMLYRFGGIVEEAVLPCSHSNV
jgi:hypothetical protein